MTARSTQDALVISLVVLAAGLLVLAPSSLAVPAAAHGPVLLAHLAALTLGFGAVLAIDWHGLLWARQRVPLIELLSVTARV